MHCTQKEIDIEILLQFQDPVAENRWAEEFNAKSGSEWANEFDQIQANQGRVRDHSHSQQDAMEQTRALAQTMAVSNDPKFKNSKFLQFVSKMSRGEIILEDNQVPILCSLHSIFNL